MDDLIFFWEGWGSGWVWILFVVGKEAGIAAKQPSILYFLFILLKYKVLLLLAVIETGIGWGGGSQGGEQAAGSGEGGESDGELLICQRGEEGDPTRG